MQEENKYTPADLILRYLEKKALPEEIKELQEWISLSEDNKRCFQELRNIWEVTDPSIRQMKINVESALLKTKSKAGIPSRQAPFASRKFITYFQRIAAVLILPLLVALTVLWLKDEEAPRPTTCQVKAPYGLVSTITLPDSSKVWLNAGSTLEYPATFTDETRKVAMDGEAYFEVHADKTHPFVVQTKSLEIIATGTAFNVYSPAESPEERITLVAGRVDVSQGNVVKQLLPGQQLNYRRASGQMEVTTIDTFKYTSWKDGIMAFRDDSLETIFRRLEQVYRVRFIINDPAVKQYTYRATFEGETLDEILNYIEESIPVSFRKREAEGNGDGAPVIEVNKN